MKTIKIILAFSLLAFSINTNAQRNTILIIADDLSPDYLGFYENAVDTVDVPNIRALLAKGIRFKNLTSNPVCSATRASILTGRYSFRTGVGGIVGGAGGSNEIDVNEISIPKLLKIHNTNIVKANIGKWHLKQPSTAASIMSPATLGYDWYEGGFTGQLASFTNWQKYTNSVASTVTNYATSENVNNALTWLKTQSTTKPFFLWLAFNAPHEPLHLPPAGLHNFTTLTGTAADINTRPKQYFKAMIQAMDHEIGRLFDSLRVMNKMDSTDIIFIGDNGNTSRTAQIANLNKAKGTVYEYGVHVPLIIAGPSVVNKGRVSNALVNTVDLFATIVEGFGYQNWRSQIPTTKPVDSKSLQPIIKNITDSVRPWVFSEIFKLTADSAEGKAMRNRNYKLIKFNYGAQEFYNLATDPLENINLLSGNLTATDVANYNYLCNEMNSLVGTGNFCNTVVASVDTASLKKNFSFSIYPNPAKQTINLKFGNGLLGDMNIRLMDNEGRLVYSKQITQTATTYAIDATIFAKGIYYLLINSGTNSFTKTVLIE